MLSIWTTVVTLLVTGICYLVASTVWDVFFGSLSKIPGPRLAAATRFVRLRHEFYGKGESWRLELHRKYGDVVRVGPSEVSFARGSAWKDIYGHAPGSQYAALLKDVAFFATNLKPAPNMVVADDIDHARQRKCFNPAFSDKALKAQEPLILGYVSHLVRNIRATTLTPEKRKIDLEKQYGFTTFDIMADLMFGEPLGCLETSKYHSWIQAVWDFIEIACVFGEIERFPRLKQLLMMLVPKSLKDMQEQHLQFSIDSVEKRLARETSRNDIWQFVLAAQAKSTKLTRAEMHSHGQLFMLAGSETSATALTGLTYYLLTNPEMMKLLTKEIRERFNSAEQINAVDALSLTFLTACINEAMRMHPAVPIGIPRMVPQGGADVCGYKIPADTVVYVHQLATYHSPQNFVHHDDFLPQRWLAADDKTGKELQFDATEFENDNKQSFQPFSVGPRNCIGQPLAWMEIRLIITHVIWHFDLELCEESKDWDKSPIFRLWKHQPLMVVATPISR